MEIKITKNYEIFKFKKENREINFNKLMKLKATLLENGRQIIPIICNKNMEVIDGQHRLAALRELNWEVMYYIDDVVTNKDLISINNTQNNWRMMDFIHYYSSLGDKSYIRLEEICKKYNDIPLKVILAAISKNKYIKEIMIKEGNINFEDEDFEIGIEALEFITNIKNNIKVKITNQSIFFFLVIKTYYLNDIDRNKLYECIINRYGTENYGNSIQCAAVIEHWYNFKSRIYRYISNEILPKR